MSKNLKLNGKKKKAMSNIRINFTNAYSNVAAIATNIKTILSLKPFTSHNIQPRILLHGVFI